MLSPGIVYDVLTVTADLAQGLFVIFEHVPPESPKSMPLGRGGRSIFLVPPLGGVLVYSPGPGSSLRDSGIGCFENHVPNVLNVSFDTCVRRVNCPALLILGELELLSVCLLGLVLRCSVRFCQTRVSLT